MPDQTKLLTPDDEIIKDRLANKHRRFVTKVCTHQIIKFFSEDFTFRCMKCNEKLFKLGGMKEFRVFCELSGIDPNSLII